MRLGMFFAIAVTALLGASCSVQDFGTKVMDKPTIMADFPTASFAATPNLNGYLSTAFTTGKYSFRYGLLSPNIWDEVWELGDISDTTGQNVNSMSMIRSTNYIPVEPNENYYIQSPAPSNGITAIYSYDINYNFLNSILYGSLSDSVYTAPTNCHFIRFRCYVAYGTIYKHDILIAKGASPVPYQPFGYGVSVDTPFLKAPRTFNLPLDSHGKPDGQFTYNGYTDDGFQWMFKYGYDYVDAAHPRTTQTCIGMTFVSEEQRDVFLGQFNDRALPRREYSNCSYKDYELGAIDATDGHCGLYLYFRPIFTSNAYVASYMSFDTGNYDDGYTDGEEYGYTRGFADGRTYEIVKDIDEVSLSYITGSGDESESHNVALHGGDAYNLLRDNCINGLLQMDAIYDAMLPSADADGAHDLVLTLSYTESRTVDAAPLYIDYKQLAEPIPYAQQTEVTVYTPVNLPVQRWIAFNAHLDVGYQGDLGKYPDHSYNERFRNYTRISVRYPTRDVGGALRYLGILSDYTRGYADGVSSRDNEVEDLTQQILDLQEDLSQYHGKDYQQIYNLGFQAGLDENAQGAATFNSLFGNILTAPLTILNGLTDISFFGMPILTAILSLLMVAMALFLFKRFK